MALFAGIVARDAPLAALPDQAVEVIEKNLSRRPGDRIQLHAGPGFAFAWLDFTDSESSCIREPAQQGAITLVAGNPLVDRGSGGAQRSRDLAELHRELSRGEFGLLRRTRGTFSAVHFDPDSRRLLLIGDKLGLRPIYYCVRRDLVLFASALRVLEASPLVPKHGDLQALAETACFGYPLGPRTALAQVRVIEAGQMVEVSPHDSRTHEYWRWDDIPVHDGPLETICEELAALFRRAVELRLGGSRRAVSLLSGGLDSRCVVATLRSLDVSVDTINFGPEGTADRVLGREMARALGTRHFEAPRGVPDFWLRLLDAYEQWRGQFEPDLTGNDGRKLWSGEGGDRVLAPVNLSEEVVSSMRAGAVDRAIAAYLRDERVGLPRRMFRRAARDIVRNMPLDGMRAELARRTSEDEGRRFHVYVLVTEARRSLSRFYENTDLSRIELIMPFYDAAVVEAAVRRPLDPFLNHRLYYRWLAHLPPVVRQVAWQAYPSSEPCPLPLPPGVRLQWQSWYTQEEDEEKWRMHVSLADSVMRAAHFPGWLLDRQVLRVARALLRMGFRSFGYLFEIAQPFVLYPLQTKPEFQS